MVILKQFEDSRPQLHMRQFLPKDYQSNEHLDTESRYSYDGISGIQDCAVSSWFWFDFYIWL